MADITKLEMVLGKPKPDADAIERLEQALQLAKDGKVHDVVICCTDQGGGLYVFDSVNHSWPAMLGCVARAGHHLNQVMDYWVEISDPRGSDDVT